MSSARLLVFVPQHPGKSWAAGSDVFTLIVRKTNCGYVAFLQKWSNQALSYTVDNILPEDGTHPFFSTQQQAEAACQKRYEQELRWSHRGER